MIEGITKGEERKLEENNKKKKKTNHWHVSVSKMNESTMTKIGYLKRKQSLCINLFDHESITRKIKKSLVFDTLNTK